MPASTISGAGSLSAVASLGLVASGIFNGNGIGHMYVNAKVYRGSIGPWHNPVVVGPGPTNQAVG